MKKLNKGWKKLNKGNKTNKDDFKKIKKSKFKLRVIKEDGEIGKFKFTNNGIFTMNGELITAKDSTVQYEEL